MMRALESARRGVGRVEPNPPVGAVVVVEGTVVGEGHHASFGGPHAEVEALAAAGPRARGSSLFVTLEPCCHHGKTPPCTDAILEAGVSEVVYAVRDPNPVVAGKGAERLAEAGVAVRALTAGPESAACRALLDPYFKWTERRLPWVTAKWAMTLDGRIATSSGDSRWITGEISRERAHRLRDRNLAVVVGIGTVRADDPLLTCRIHGGRSPYRVVIDSRASLSCESRLVRTRDDAPLLVAVSETASSDAVFRLERAGVEVLRLPASLGGRVRLDRLAEALASRGLVTLLVEGGAAILGGFFDSALVDEVEVHISPRIVGGAAAPPAVGGAGVARLAEAYSLTGVALESLGPDFVVTGRLARKGG